MSGPARETGSIYLLRAHPGTIMALEVSCIHAGFESCAFRLRTEDEDELIEVVTGHAHRVHGVVVDAEHVRRIAVEA